MLELQHLNELGDYLRTPTSILTIYNKKVQVDLKIVCGKNPIDEIVNSHSQFHDE